MCSSDLKHEILALRGGFHGRLFGTLAATDRPQYRAPFRPLAGGISIAERDLDELDAALNPDLFVLPSQSIVIRTLRFPQTMAPDLAALPGVRRVQMVRNGRVSFGGKPVMIVAIEVKSIAELARRRPVEGDEDDMYRRTAAGEGLMVSDNLARLRNLHVGDVIDGTVASRMEQARRALLG